MSTGRTIHREAKDTLTAVEMDCGDTLSFRLRNGQTRTLALEETSARVLLTNLKDTHREEPLGRTLYHFTCRVRVDGHPMAMERYVCSQESFYEPYVINGMRVWFDAVSDIFDLIEETHGACRPGRQARFAVNDARDPICPEALQPWCPIEGEFIPIGDCYNGDDCWMGPYLGASAHGGLDLNHPRGTPLWAPIDIHDHFLFNSLAAGHDNNRWRGFHHWPNGDTWVLQSHHVIRLLVGEHVPFPAGTHYAEAAGVLVGAHEHSHFVFKVMPAEGGAEILLDPWILFRQIFENARRRKGLLRAAMAPLAPATTGQPVAFRSEGLRPPRPGALLSCHWSFGDGGGSLEDHPVHTFTKPGIYPVTLVVDDGAGRAECTQHLTVDGPPVQAPALVLAAPDEPSFRPRPAHAMDVYGRPPAVTPRTLAFVARDSRPVPRAKEVVVLNAGGGSLPPLLAPRVTYGAGEGWLKVAVEGGERAVVAVDAGDLAPGQYWATVLVECPGAINSPQPVCVRLDVRAAPPQSDVVVDDRDAGFFCTPYFWVGHEFDKWEAKGYGGSALVNGGRPREGEFARFTPDLEAGTYRVSLAEETPFAPDSRFAVRVRHRDGEKKVWVEPCRSRLIGTFAFDEGTDGFVEILAGGSSGQVVADAVSFERAGASPDGHPS